MFLYIVSGEVTVAGQNATAFHLVHMNDDGDAIELQAVTDAAVIFGHAALLHEPIAAQGPFVMNTGEEIVQAIRDYQAGKFGDAYQRRRQDVDVGGGGGS